MPPAAVGWRGYAGAKKQVDFTTYAAADDFARVQSVGIAKNPEFVELALVGNSRFPQVELVGNAPVGGDIVMPVNIDDVIGLFLKDLLGLEAFSTPATGVFKHQFDPQAALGTPGISVEYTNDPTIAGNVWQAEGGHVAQIAFAAPAGQPLISTTSMTFRDTVQGGADQTPVTYGPNIRYMMANRGVATLGGVSGGIRDFSLAIGAQLVDTRFAYGSDKIEEQLPAMYAITGQIIIVFKDLVQVNNFLNNTATDLNIAYHGDIINAVQTKIEFDLNNLFLRGMTPVVEGPDEHLLTIPFTAKSGVAANLLRIILTNSVGAAY